jgi:plasmid stabilization system protein ParE
VSQPARFSQIARREIAQALRDIEHRRTREALSEAAQRLGENPSLGSVRPPFSPRFRFWSLPRFGYILAYDPNSDPVEILRCVHTRRDLPQILGELLA